MPELQEIQRQIHAEISSLQEQLAALNTIRIELEQAKKLVEDHITKIDEYIRSIQTHSTNLLNLFSRYADEIKDHIVKEINRAISSLEAVANETIRTVNSLKEEIKNLLQTNKELVLQATQLFKQIDDINLPERFDILEAAIKSLKSDIDAIHRENVLLKKQNKVLIYFSIGIATISLTTLIILLWKVF